MADVAITLKLSASEFQTLREELRSHEVSLDAKSHEAKVAGDARASRDLLQRAATVSSLREKLG